MNPGRELERARPRTMPMPPTCDRPMSMNYHLRANLEQRSQAYQLIEELGRGSFGVTYKAQNVRSKENVAIKDVVSQGSSSCLCKEGQILQTLNHPNIVNLLSLWNRGSGDNVPPECPALVLELCHSNLIDVMRQHKDKIGLGHVKYLALELMEGLKYIHSRRVIHRDIKPDNILLTGNGVLKICDFGLATFMRENHDGRCYSPGVGSKNFMAPELLLETTRYNEAVDIWAAGCTIAELISCQRFIPGNSTVELVARMIFLLGTIDRTTLPQRLDLPFLDRTTFPKYNGQMDCHLAKITSDDLARDFLRSLLQLNPDSRLSASDALSHSFFVRDPRPERLILVADSTDRHDVQVSSESDISVGVDGIPQNTSTLDYSSLQVGACHDVSDSYISVGEEDISVGKEEFSQSISPPAMQNNNEAGHASHPICISSESANSDTNLMRQDYHQDPLSASDVINVISSDMDVQVQHVPPPSGFPSTAMGDTVQHQSQGVPHPTGFPATARVDNNNNTTQVQPQAASHAPELLSTAEINAIRRQFQLLPPPGYLQPQIPYQQMSHMTQIALAHQLRPHQLTHPGHPPGVSGVPNHQPNYPYQQQYQNPQHAMQPGGHFHGPYFCDRVHHNTHPY